MLSKADDYPVHQRPEPIATAGTDRNFYDRYFFQGQSADGQQGFAAALGVYPHLNIVDAAFCWMEGGIQRSVFGSQILHGERLSMRAGPIAVEVLQPLQRLRVTLAETDGLAADLVFEGRHAPIEEPRFTHRLGSRLLMDVTRMTQNGTWSGTATIDGVGVCVDRFRGTRDRSWGIRPIGAADAQPHAPVIVPQFFWLWAPLNFDRYCLYFHTNDDAEGVPWNRSAVLVDLDTGKSVKLVTPHAAITFRPRTRTAASAQILAGHPSGGAVRIDLHPAAAFYMRGLGYGHPKHGHGSFHGEHMVASERLDAANADASIPANGHIQALVAAELLLPDGTRHVGRGVLEQLIIGPHAPSGFREIYDLA